ncbi:hypothetical protein MEX01_20940 [Methylorubrum extorquens]|jgi:hypothetical protein|nr:hypothetical protein [Methylorubrum extorquens]MDF9862163.1 hypothetical protein [Methylorubrum pseudosasae]MDH6635781.1 hypothetical protein [Methylobacterium sp. SuP10 SLI 274]MDH6664956.1 hypothetical protein [Methylorubrum zatmanii]MDF9790458.1 hypothetical protein [Methylorubrum extorquens]
MIVILALFTVSSLAIAAGVAVRAKQTLIDDAQTGTRGYF